MASLALPTGAAAAAAAGVAKAAFNYNRGNYQYDEGARRFTRYTTGFNMAQAQTKMYREDIEDLTKLTVTKQDTYHTVGTIFFVLNFQLIMAGRLGVHGPSPPGWLLGLYWTNICSALMFLTVFTWTAMHASARATAGAAYMRTRTIRLPIPTPKQLDRARTTGNRFEKQRLAEVFRIPFVMPAPRDKTQDEEDPEDCRRVPKWYQEDEVRELYASSKLATDQANPEHFELHRGLQEEWWAYDVYSRIGALYFMSHWLSSASLYSMCHIFTELRCIWPAWTVTACFVASQYGILQLDIVKAPSERGANFQVEKYVPLVPFFAVAGMTIDYSVLSYNPIWHYIVYALSLIGYALQFMWALRLYELASPRAQKEKKEVDGRPWTPCEWHLPPAFEEMAYICSAPKQKNPELTCLSQEMRVGRGGDAKCVKKAESAEASLHAWKLFRGACISTIAMWSLIIFGRVFEMVNGERMLLKQEGRVERWPSHVQPWMPPWSRFGTRNEHCHAGGCDRRLGEDASDVSLMAHQLVGVLRPLVHALETPNQPKEPKQVSDMPRVLDVAWPGDLRPVHLAAAGDLVAALGRDFYGVIMKVTELEGGNAGDMAPFQLQGLSSLGEVSGSNLGDTGLIVTMATGEVAECAGMPVDGIWACEQTGPTLPSFGQSMKAAVAARKGTGTLRAAVALDEGEEGTLLLLEADEDGSSWLPVGEVRMPFVHDQMHLSLSSLADSVYMSTSTGEVLKWAFDSAEPVEQASPLNSGLRTEWYGACPLGDNQVVHLATQPSEAGPKLYVRATSA